MRKPVSVKNSFRSVLTLPEWAASAAILPFALFDERGRVPQSSSQALFFELMAEKADQRCSTFLLPQCGQRISPSSQSTRDRILSKNFLQAWQMNSYWGIDHLPAVAEH